MNLRLSDRHALMSDEAVDRTESKLHAAVSKFGDWVHGVELFVEDSNAHKGGVDKRCKLKIRLSRGKNLFVESEHQSLSRALSEVIARAEKLVLRTIQKLSKKGFKRKMQFAMPTASN